MVNVFESLFPGIVLGLVAGLSPGPMLALVIAETLKFGKEEGFKVAVSPLITDSTIVLLTLLGLSTLAEHDLVIGTISIFGACYLIHIGLENLRTRTSRFEVVIKKKEAFKRAIITNARARSRRLGRGQVDVIYQDRTLLLRCAPSRNCLNFFRFYRSDRGFGVNGFAISHKSCPPKTDNSLLGIPIRRSKCACAV